MSSSCSTQAVFIERNLSRAIPVNGMKMGCTPSQSFLSSTLECFYNQSCLNLIQHYTGSNASSGPLPTQKSRFSPSNTTIAELVNELFLEDWSIDKNYSLYYEQCSPLVCSYTIVEKFNIIYIITLVLGLQGGITIVLKWFCPKMIRLGFKIYNRRKNQVTAVGPDTTDDITIRQTTSNSEIQPTNSAVTRNRSFRKIMCTVILVICVAIGISCFSIYYAYKNRLTTTNAPIDDNFNITTTVMAMSTTSNVSEPVCLFKYEQMLIDSSCSFISSRATVVTDINGDNHIDLIFSCGRIIAEMVHVLLGNGKSSFRQVFTFPPSNFFYEISWIRVADLNNDHRADLVLAHCKYSKINIAILFGNGNGTFQMDTGRSLLLTSVKEHVSIIDMNNDTKLDLIAIGESSNRINVYYGNGNGTFSSPSVLLIGINSVASQLAVADLDNDNYLDLIVMDTATFSIHVFFGNKDGSFQLHKRLFVSTTTYKTTMIVADFDGDLQSDIILAQSHIDTVLVTYRYNNGTFHDKKQIVLKSEFPFDSVALGDLNHDKLLDIVVTKDARYEIYGFLQDRNGNFQVQTIYLGETYGEDPWSDVKDFNNDNCQDIISASTEFEKRSIFLNTCECP
ncbi:unnamed protein product [Adineta ricciae]|nr:unnamed protein product [Adineta ricciae]